MGGFQYVDGVGNVSVVNGMAHVDFVVVRPPVAEGQQPRIEPVQHLVMALPQFVRLCAEMAGHLQRMEEKGLIKRQPSVGLSSQAPATSPNPPSAAQLPSEEEQKRSRLFGLR